MATEKKTLQSILTRIATLAPMASTSAKLSDLIEG